jgi:hypothetical protein
MTYITHLPLFPIFFSPLMNMAMLAGVGSRLAVCVVVASFKPSRLTGKGHEEREVRRGLRGALEEGGHRRLKGEGHEGRKVAGAKTEWTCGRENRQEQPRPGAAVPEDEQTGRGGLLGVGQMLEGRRRIRAGTGGQRGRGIMRRWAVGRG